MECPKCGATIPDDSKFCPECGSEIKKEQSAPQFGASSQQPQFGASSQQPQFGAQSSDIGNQETIEEPQATNESSSNNQMEFGAGEEKQIKKGFAGNAKGFLSRIFQLQPPEFWGKYYIISAVFLVFAFMSGVTGSPFMLVVSILNFVLYPLTETILQEGTKAIGINYVGNALKTNPNTSPWIILFMYIIKFIYKWFLWSFSVIIGPISALYMNHVGKKMGL